MYCVMGCVTDTNHILRIEKTFMSSDNVFDGNWNYVMQYYQPADLSVFDSEVATHVTNDNIPSEISPHCRSVKRLIQVSVEPKSLFSDFAFKAQVLVSLDESRQCYQLGVRFNTRHRYHHAHCSFGKQQGLSDRPHRF